MNATVKAMSYTPEPWNVTEILCGEKRDRIAVTLRNASRLISDFGRSPQSKRDADHIARCVNSCTGLNPAAYRTCVEALKAALARLEIETENDGTLHPTVKTEVEQARQALAYAEEKG